LTCNLELQSVSGCQSALTSDDDGCLPAELELQELEELHGRSFSVISSGDSDEDSSADTVSNRRMQRSYGADSSLACAQAMTSSQDTSSFSEDSSDGSDLSAEESEDEGDDDDDDDDEEEDEGGESRSSDGDGAASPTTDSYDGLSSSDLV